MIYTGKAGSRSKDLLLTGVVPLFIYNHHLQVMATELYQTLGLRSDATPDQSKYFELD